MKNLSDYIFQTFTLIYLVDKGNVLLLKRAPDGRAMAGLWVGLGGKIEAGESLEAAAMRECFEESGLTPQNFRFRGTFQWLSNNIISQTHIIVSDHFTGSLVEENREGTLAWHKIGGLRELDSLASYQLHFLPTLLEEKEFFYSGIGVFDGDQMTDYIQARATWRTL